jgi:hypothetical protein
MKIRTKLTAKLAIGMIVGMALFSGCQPDELLPEIETLSQPESYLPPGEMMALGKELENPYSVENMLKAYMNLTSNGRIAEDIEIQTTHYYVRFLPADTAEVATLEIDTTLELWDHPLLFEIEQSGSWYHDPSIPDSLPTWQYTVVEKDYEFPSVTHEILADLFMVDEDSTETSSGRISSSLWDELEYEALRITNNLDEPQDASGGRIAASKWRPYGRIRIEERTGGVDRGDVPLRYCKVRARKLLKFGSANTSVSTGVFSITKDFRGEVNYSLEFETAGHKVTDFFGFSVNHKADDKIKGPWYLDIGFNDEDSWVCGTILNSIYHFRTQASIHRIKLPGVLATVKVRPKYKEGRSNALRVVRHYPLLIALLIRNDVVMYTEFDNGVRLETDDFYALTMHELAHVSHYLKSPANIALTDGITRESWANAVGYYFTLPYYPNIVTTRYVGTNITAAFEGENDLSRTDIIDGGDDSWQYTPFFIDLRDNTNQRTIHSGNTEWANDNVSGYTLEQMQEALDKRTRLDGVCEHLRNNYSNGTEGNLNELVRFYEDIKDNH